MTSLVSMVSKHLSIPSCPFLFDFSDRFDNRIVDIWSSINNVKVLGNCNSKHPFRPFLELSTKSPNDQWTKYPVSGAHKVINAFNPGTPFPARLVSRSCFKWLPRSELNRSSHHSFPVLSNCCCDDLRGLVIPRLVLPPSARSLNTGPAVHKFSVML